MVSKPSVLVLLLALLSVAGMPVRADDRVAEAAQKIEARLGARVGVAVYIPAENTWRLYNADQRFPMASTFKVLACAALLAGDVPDSPTMLVEELQEYSPVTKDMVGQLISPYRLCHVTLRPANGF